MLANTPGYRGWAHPRPQLTIPICNQVWFILQTSGLPESPCKGRSVFCHPSVQVCSMSHPPRSPLSGYNRAQSLCPEVWHKCVVITHLDPATPAVPCLLQNPALIQNKKQKTKNIPHTRSSHSSHSRCPQHKTFLAGGRMLIHRAAGTRTEGLEATELPVAFSRCCL